MIKYQLIYTYNCATDLSDIDILDKIHHIQEFNKNNGIKGILVHKEGQFLQLLEGNKRNIDVFYNQIIDDPQYSNFEKIAEYDNVNSNKLIAHCSITYRNPKNMIDQTCRSFMIKGFSFKNFRSNHQLLFKFLKKIQINSITSNNINANNDSEVTRQNRKIDPNT